MKARAIALSLVLLVGAPAASGAQEAGAELVGRTVRVWTGGVVLEGELTAFRPSGLTLAAEGGERSVEWSAVEHVNVLTLHRRTLLYTVGGAVLVGLSSAVIAGLAEICPVDPFSPVPCDHEASDEAARKGLLIGGAVGAGLGALVAHLLPSRRWAPVVKPAGVSADGAWRVGIALSY